MLVKIRFPAIIWTLSPTVIARRVNAASTFNSAKFFCVTHSILASNIQGETPELIKSKVKLSCGARASLGERGDYVNLTSFEYTSILLLQSMFLWLLRQLWTGPLFYPQIARLS
jgi:hypothetical protein